MAVRADPVASALDGMGFGAFQRRLVLLCATGYFAMCSELLLAVFLEEPLMGQFGLSKSEYAWFPFTVSLCSFVSSFCAGKLADLYGRRFVFAVSLVLVGGAGILCALSTSFPVIIGLRSLVGIGTGGLAVVDYVVFQEFTPKAARGWYLYAVFGAGCLGVLYLAAIAAFGHLAWQWLVVLAAVPTLPAGLLRCVLTSETPHYLAASGREADAYTVLQLIGRENNALHQLPCQQDFIEQIRAMPCEFPTPGELTAVLSYSPVRLTIPLAVIWLLQSTAYWGLTLFLPEYFKAAGVAPNQTIFAMVACELPGCIVAALLTEHPRVGRVRTLRINFAIASFGAIVLGAIARPVGLVAFLACLVYFSMIPNWGVLFIYSPESYPTELRGTAVGFFQMLQGIPSVFSPFLSASLVQMGHAYMIVWGGCLLAALLTSSALEAPVCSPASAHLVNADALAS